MISLAQAYESGQLSEPMDFAIECGNPVVLHPFNVVLVPDMRVIEIAAQGEFLPDAPQLKRNDGRSVYVFAWDGVV